MRLSQALLQAAPAVSNLLRGPFSSSKQLACCLGGLWTSAIQKDINSFPPGCPSSRSSPRCRR